MPQNHRQMVLLVAASTLTILAMFSSAMAQESRADDIAQRQAEKAAAAHPYEPAKAERVFLAVKREFLETPSGVYPLFGSVYGGGGLALGGGYRQYYGDRTFWNAKALWSIRNYKFAELSTDSAGHAHGRIDLTANVGWRDATRVAYYGLGTKTPPDNHASFRFKQAYASAAIKARPVSWVALDAGLAYEDYRLEKGLGARPSIEKLFSDSAAPALGASPQYIHSSGSVGIDWRPAAGYARRGGLYELRYHNYRDRNDVYNFDRLDAEVVQHLPLLRENWVVSLHGLVNMTLDNAAVAPFFLLPSLGSSDTLRGYSAWRFRDRHSLLLQGEFRWIPNRNGLDMAIFYDAGKVTSRRSEVDLNGLKKDVGIEVRFHGPGVTPLRLGIARGNEGWHLVFGGSAAF